jgi:hypothetical protein
MADDDWLWDADDEWIDDPDDLIYELDKEITLLTYEEELTRELKTLKQDCKDYEEAKIFLDEVIDDVSNDFEVDRSIVAERAAKELKELYDGERQGEVGQESESGHS